MTVNTRYKILPRFPKHVIEEIEKTYNEKIGDDRVDSFVEDYKQIQPNLKVAILDCNIKLSEFKNTVSFLMSKPNSGMAICHTDKSRDFAVNIPIRVNPDKGDFIAGRFESLSDYPKGELQFSEKSHTLEDFKKEYPHYADPSHPWYVDRINTGLKWDYDEKYFENVKMYHPIFINTEMPHSYINDDDEWRVIGSLELKERDLKKALQILDKWV